MDLSAFPEEVECEPCGRVHYYAENDIEVAFLPTPELLRSARENGQA